MQALVAAEAREAAWGVPLAAYGFDEPPAFDEPPDFSGDPRVMRAGGGNGDEGFHLPSIASSGGRDGDGGGGGGGNGGGGAIGGVEALPAIDERNGSMTETAAVRAAAAADEEVEPRMYCSPRHRNAQGLANITSHVIDTHRGWPILPATSSRRVYTPLTRTWTGRLCLRRHRHAFEAQSFNESNIF